VSPKATAAAGNSATRVSSPVAVFHARTPDTEIRDEHRFAVQPPQHRTAAGRVACSVVDRQQPVVNRPGQQLHRRAASAESHVGSGLEDAAGRARALRLPHNLDEGRPADDHVLVPCCLDTPKAFRRVETTEAKR
jgi:hypothetical protein